MSYRKWMSYRTGKYTVCKRVRASFCPVIVQAAAVKGLIVKGVQKQRVKLVKKRSFFVCFFNANISFGIALFG